MCLVTDVQDTDAALALIGLVICNCAAVLAALAFHRCVQRCDSPCRVGPALSLLARAVEILGLYAALTPTTVKHPPVL